MIAAATMYEVSTQAIWSCVADRLPCMCGSATLAMVLSSACRIEASITESVMSPRCGRRRVVGAAVADCARQSAADALRGLARQRGERRIRVSTLILRVDRHLDAQAGAQRRCRVGRAGVCTGTRCTTLTQLPVAFSGGSSENCEPVPGLTLTTRALKARPG